MAARSDSSLARWPPAVSVPRTHLLARCVSPAVPTNEPPAPGAAGVNMNEIYAKFLITGGIRTVGAMVLSVVPALLFFRRSGLRMFCVGATGGLVGGWHLHSAEVVLKNPVQNRDLIPKAATVSECVEELQREYYELLGRGFSFGNFSNGATWLKDRLQGVWKTSNSPSSAAPERKE